MKRKKKIWFAVVIAVSAGFWLWSVSGWESAFARLDSDLTVGIYRKRSHPFQAEYYRGVKFFRKEGNIGRLDYPKDTGGGFPLEVRFYAGEQVRLVRFTDQLYDRLFDLKKSYWAEGQNPPPGKDSASFVQEQFLPPLKSHFKISEELEAVEQIVK